jgi:Asp-tRNA(Asn)/Glu-tRNA(Gln) amidotransferase C subunit
MILTGKTSTGSETCSIATLYTTILTWYGLESKLGLRGDRPATRLTEGSNRLRRDRPATRLTEGSDRLRGDRPATRLTEGSDRLRGPESQCGRFKERNNEQPIDNKKNYYISRNYQETFIN